MNTVALINPTTLVGKELRERLEQRPELWQDLRLLTTRSEEIGRLTEVAGAAAMVQELTPEALETIDLAFLCGPRGTLQGALDALPTTATAVLLAPDAEAEDGPALVAGVNSSSAIPGGVLVSPHPAVIGACHLLHPLAAFGPTTAVATVLQPASIFDEEGLDELFEQTRLVLNFGSDRPQEIFRRQLTLNIMPLAQPLHGLGAQAREILGGQTEVALHVLQAGVFHGTSVSLFVRLKEDPGEGAVREALEASPFLRLEQDEALLSPIDVVAQDEMLVGEVNRESGSAGIYHIWGVLDNLTLGGALNALRIAEAIV